MIESQVRALFSEIANGEPGAPRVDTRLAHCRGRVRLRWRRAGLAGAPVAAAAAVTAVVLAVGAAAPPGPGPVSGPTAPRQFGVLDPYLSFGWLPAGNKVVEGGTTRQYVWLVGAHIFDTPLRWSLTVDATGKCRLTAPVPGASPGTPAATAPASGPGAGAPARELKCSTPEQKGFPIRITGRAPAVRGHRAFWGGPVLIWKYLPNGWAELRLPLVPNSTAAARAAAARNAVTIADHIRYGAGTPPLLFAFQLTHLPSRWQVSSLDYMPDAGVLRVNDVTLGAGPPDLGADGGLVYETGLPYFSVGPATRRTEACGRGKTEIINGYQVVLTNLTEGTLLHQSLCAGNADGLSLGIAEFGAHPAISVAGLFGHHMRLLGRHPANWTSKPIG
jgi:hypothetical protein